MKLKNIYSKLWLTFFCAATICLHAVATNPPGIAWFQEARLGLFIHWGLYSEAGGVWNGKPSRGGEHFMLYERIPLKEYAKLAERFNPTAFDAEQWVKTAKHAGMKYLVITTKHHEGFAMFDSPCSDYDIMDCTPFGRDPIKELADACHKEGIRLGFYYSLGRDWEDPDVPTNWPQKGGRSNTWDYPDEDEKNLAAYLERKVKPQLRELLTQYGQVDILWFDTPELVTRAQGEEIRDLIHSLQPECLINARIGNGLGDFETVEQKLTDGIESKPWEANLTMGRNWGYNRYDTVYKQPDMIVRYLTDIVSKGGNMLLNVAPDGLGRFPAQSAPIFETLHEWMATNGEAIYGTKPWRTFGENIDPDQKEEVIQAEFDDAVFNGFPQQRIPDVRYTTKGNTVYAIVRHTPGTEVLLRAFTPADKVRSVKCLYKGHKPQWTMSDKGLSVRLKSPVTEFPVYVLKIKVE